MMLEHEPISTDTPLLNKYNENHGKFLSGNVLKGLVSDVFQFKGLPRTY